ncbi:hypothetical protein ACU8V3_11345 [Cobetia marina]
MYEMHQQAKLYAEIATQAIMGSLGYKMGRSQFSEHWSFRETFCSLKLSVASRPV